MKLMRKTVVCLLMAFAMLVSSLPVSWLQVSAKEEEQQELSEGQRTERALTEEDVQEPEPIPTVSIPADATLWSGHYYKVYSTKMTAAQADAHCKSLGGYLATITSEGERGLIAGLIGNISTADPSYVIGGRTGNFDEGNSQNGGSKDGSYENTGALWDTGEKDVLNIWCKSYGRNWCETTDSAYRILSYYQSYYNTPIYREAGYYWDTIHRDYADTTYGFVCEWGDQIDIAEAECTLSQYYMTYDGTTKTPALTVKYKGITLENGYDYAYEYLNNLNVGTATVSIVGTGRFKGSTAVTFSVEPKMTLSVTDSGEITTVSCKTGELPMEDKEYLERFVSEFSLNLSEKDAEKCVNESYSYVISDDGKSAVWKASLLGAENGSIDVVVSSKAGQKVSKNNVKLRPVFEVKRYQADYLLNSETRLNSMEAFLTMESPSKILVENSEKNNLGNAVSMWNELTKIGDAADDASTILDVPLREKEMYEAILIDILQEAMEDRMVSAADEIAQKAQTAVDVVTEVSENVKDMRDFYFYILDGEEYKKTDLEGVINAAVKQLEKMECFKDKKITIQSDDISAWADKVSAGAEKVSTGAELLELAADYMEYILIAHQIAEMTDEMQEVLKEMYAASKSNTNLRLALMELSSLIDGADAVMLHTGYVAGKFMLKSSIDAIWKSVRSGAGPIVNGYIALYNADKFVVDQLTGSDRTAEAFVKMDAVLEIEKIVKSIYYSKKARYKGSKDIKDAAVYLAATDIYFYTLTVDCKYALDFCDAVGSAWMSKLLGLVGANDAAELKKSVTSIGNSVAVKRGQVATDWIYQLEVDYPSEYERYKNIIEEKEKATAYYQIQCPVNVEVYSVSGKLAASVADHKAYWDGTSSIVVAAAGDGAQIWFYGNEDYYNLQYTGTDTGSMDITIQKYDSEGNEVQKVQYNEVPLEAGKVYTSEENLNSQTGSYGLTDEADKWNPVDPDVDTASPVKQKRNLTVTNGYFIYNEAEGIVKSAECYPGEVIQIFTAGMNDTEFLGWKAVSGTVSFLDQKAEVTSFVMPDTDVEIEAEYKLKDSVLLAKAQKNAIQELTSYKDESLYRPEQKQELSAAITAGTEAIETAVDTAGVEAALADAKKAIDAIKTDAQLTAEEQAAALEQAREDAKEELAAYKEADLYRPAQQKELAEAIASGNEAIDAEEDAKGIAKALANAKKAIDAIKTDAQLTEEEEAALEQAREKAREELSAYKAADLYRPAQQEELSAAIASGNTAIDAASDAAGVEAALASAKKAIDAIKTDAQLTEEETEKPANPTTPDSPAQPDQPSQPSNPSEPNQPSQPSNPSETDKPSQPSNPSETDKPSQPGNPSVPGGSSQTVNPPANTSTVSLPKAGSKKKSGKIWYKIITSSKKSKTVSVIKPVKKTNKNLTIPDTIKIDGMTYKVTAIADKAFCNNKKLTKVLIGKNVTKIGKQAFSGCKKLKAVVIKSAKLKTIGKNAFTKLHAKAKISVPKKKLADYKKRLKKAKTPKTVKIVKY